MRPAPPSSIVCAPILRAFVTSASPRARHRRRSRASRRALVGSCTQRVQPAPPNLRGARGRCRLAEGRNAAASEAGYKGRRGQPRARSARDINILPSADQRQRGLPSCSQPSAGARKDPSRRSTTSRHPFQCHLVSFSQAELRVNASHSLPTPFCRFIFRYPQLCIRGGSHCRPGRSTNLTVDCPLCGRADHEASQQSHAQRHRLHVHETRHRSRVREEAGACGVLSTTLDIR